MTLQILIVEDSLSKRLKITEAFRGFPVSIESALHFSRAVDLLKFKKFDWVISGLKIRSIEGMGDGLQLWSLVKQIQPQSGFILLSSNPAEVSFENFQLQFETPHILKSPADSDALRHLFVTNLRRPKQSEVSKIWTRRAA